MSHAWMPTSPCDAGCLTAGTPTVALPRRFARIVAACGVVLLAFASLPALLVARPEAREALVRLVFRSVFWAFGVRLVVHGERGFTELERGRGALVVNNHISWLDIAAINAVRPMRALAKHEISQWPVLGGLVARGGSIFLDRERLFTLPATVAELAEALRGGALVNVTPEGTTWCGLASGRFTAATFQAAIDGGVPVRPIALRYRLSDGRETTQPAFIGPESLIDSIRRVVRVRGLVLEMFVCEEIAPGRAANRRELAALAQSAVRAALGTVSHHRPVPAPSLTSSSLEVAESGA
jgi:1-acyl-sn-glycerol-3-phosphate acyltransferase